MKRVVRAYKTRMQIEDAFRDLKSERFGLGFEASRAVQVQRIGLLLLIAMLILFVAWVIGYCVEAADLARRYQANTVTRHKVLSIIYMGRRAWRDPASQFRSRQLYRALETISQLVAQQAEGF
jgi:hypothetical protein